ncbi:HNH endonuclease [Terricaulis silvestris]|uniref:HNH endonuclease n=1 Tax=Terricaulis silvestris TaxID=2686094 RepID=UPI00131AA77D
MKTRAGKPNEIHCRQRPSRRLKQCIWDAQGGRCLACDQRLVASEFDHVVPLGLGGSNAPDNWAALCVSCHRTKTVEDLRRIAKAKRQRRYHETGRSRAAKTWSPFNSAAKQGFSKTLRRHLNGFVTRRCPCAVCSGENDFSQSSPDGADDGGDAAPKCTGSSDDRSS